MKVLLIQDVDNLGYAGEVKDVANGYGRNFLLPQQLAVLATPGALKQAETIRKAAEKERAQKLEDAKAIVSQLEGLELLFERRAGETGRLYGSVTSNDIAEAIEEQTGIAIDKRKVALPEPIRELDEQEVTIKVMIDLSTTVKVEVLPLGGILERERLSEAEQEAMAEEAAAEAEEEEAAPTAEAEPEVAAVVVEAEEEAEAEPEAVVAEEEAEAEPEAAAEEAEEEAEEEESKEEG